MSWLLAAILSYFLFAVVALGDKYILRGIIPSPKIYAFYVGILGILILFLAPFVFFFPAPWVIVTAISAGIFHILGIFAYFTGLKIFDASRVVSAIGGLAPIFTFGLIFIFTGGETLSLLGITAFFLLILGTIIVTWQGKGSLSFKSLKISALASLLFALYFLLAKLTYSNTTFINGFIWTRVGAFLAAAAFLLFPEVRSQVFGKKEAFRPKTLVIFLPVQAAGACGFLLQNWAFSLAGITYVAVISALGGIQYVFLFILAVILSLKFPQIIKEETSGKILFQKITAILLIGAGLVILSF